MADWICNGLESKYAVVSSKSLGSWLDVALLLPSLDTRLQLDNWNMYSDYLSRNAPKKGESVMWLIGLILMCFHPILGIALICLDIVSHMIERISYAASLPQYYRPEPVVKEWPRISSDALIVLGIYIVVGVVVIAFLKFH